MFPEFDTRTKREQSKRQKSSTVLLVGVSFGRIFRSLRLTFISRCTGGPHVCLSHSGRHRLPRVKILPVKRPFAVAIVAAALCLDADPSHAGMYGDSRWCAVTNQGTDAFQWDCEYDTIEECTPAVLTGNRGYCAMNPYWRPAPDRK